MILWFLSFTSLRIRNSLSQKIFLSESDFFEKSLYISHDLGEHVITFADDTLKWQLRNENKVKVALQEWNNDGFRIFWELSVDV